MAPAVLVLVEVRLVEASTACKTILADDLSCVLRGENEKFRYQKRAGREVSSMWEQPQRPTQRCVKFIRWLRCWFFVEAPWHAAVAALAASFASG